MTQTKTIKTKQKQKRKTNKPAKNFLTNKRAASVALTTMIITAGVLAAGITILYWTYSMGNIANQEYSTAVSTSQDAIKENIGFEYIHYNPEQNTLTLYLINCGKTDDMKIVGIYIYDASSTLVASYHSTTQESIQLNYFDPAQTSWDPGVEVHFDFVPDNTLADTSYYTLRLITQRGRNFDTTFSTP